MGQVFLLSIFFLIFVKLMQTVYNVYKCNSLACNVVRYSTIQDMSNVFLEKDRQLAWIAT